MPLRRGELQERETTMTKLLTQCDFLTCKFVVLVPLVEQQSQTKELVTQLKEIKQLSVSYFDYASQLFSLLISFLSFKGIFSLEMLFLQEEEDQGTLLDEAFLKSSDVSQTPTSESWKLAKQEIRPLMSLLSKPFLRNVLETLRVGRSLEMLWDRSSIMSSSQSKRILSLVLSMEQRLKSLDEARKKENEPQARKTSPKLTKKPLTSKEAFAKRNLSGNFRGTTSLSRQTKQFVIENTSGGRNQRYGGKSISYLGQRGLPISKKKPKKKKTKIDGSHLLDMDDINDMDVFEKMIMSKSFKKKNSKEQSNSRYKTEEISGNEHLPNLHDISNLQKNSNRYSTEDDPEFSSLINSKKKLNIQPNTSKSRYEKKIFFESSDSDPNPDQNLILKAHKIDPVKRQTRMMNSRELVWILARTVLNLVKHQAKRSEIALKSLLKHKELAYQQIRKGIKNVDKSVNLEDQLDDFLETQCNGNVKISLEEFSQENEEHFERIRSDIVQADQVYKKSTKKKDFFKIFSSKKHKAAKRRNEHKIDVKNLLAGKTLMKLVSVDCLYLLDWIALNPEQVGATEGDRLEVKLSYVLLSECVAEQNRVGTKKNIKNLFSRESFTANENFEGVRFEAKLERAPTKKRRSSLVDIFGKKKKKRLFM